MDMMSLRRRVMVNQNKLMTATGNPITFNTPLTKPLKECAVRFTPKQEGSGTPSPDNVREISGRSSVKLWQSGKNLVPPSTDTSFWTIGWLNTNGTVSASNNPYLTSDFIKVKGGDTYALQVYDPTETQLPSAWKCYGFYDSDQVFISDAYHGSTSTSASSVVVPDNAKYMRISFTSGNRNTGVTYLSQLEFGSEATAYEPYSALNEITFTFPETVGDNGVVYGGYLDAENGEVVEEYVYRDMTTFSSIKAPSGTSEPWNHRFSLQHWANNTAGYDRVAGAQVMCDCIDTANGSGRTNYTGDASTAVWYVYDDTISTVAEFKEKYAGHYVAYRRKVALHEHYSLTPQSIATLRGSNVMWSDANGDITVKYWTR